MSVGTITTEAELAALPERTAVVDRMGDVGTVLGGMLRYPETTPQTFERAAKKYGPFHIVYSPPVPEPEVGVAGRASALHTSNVHGFCHLAGPDLPSTFAFTSDEGVTVPWSDVTNFVPDPSTPTLAEIVDAMCAHDPENGNGEIGTHTHSHDPADGECYWSMTVGPQIAHLWSNGGAS